MKAWLARNLLALFGWKTEGWPPNIKKYIMIAAPHTTSWDAVLLVLMAAVYGIRIRWMMKAEMFRGPAGPFFKALGGMPIDRSQRHNTVQQCIDAFNKSEELILVVPPEGTRKAAKAWKSGFYHIAQGANVPLALAFLDFKRKRGGFGPTVHLTGDVDSDMATIRAFYTGISGKYPEKFGPIELELKK